MTNYYNVDEAFRKVSQYLKENNPAKESVFLKQFGQVQFKTKTPITVNTTEIQFEAFRSEVEPRVSSKWIVPETAAAETHTATAIVKWFQWSLTLTEQDMFAYGVQNDPYVKAKVNDMIVASNSALVHQIDTWLTGVTAGDVDEDNSWLAPFSNSSGGTFANPSDCCIAAGTKTNLGTVNFTGDGITSFPLQKSVVLDIQRMKAKIDSSTGAAIMRDPNHAGRDEFVLIVNEGVKTLLETESQYLGAAGQYKPFTMAEELAKSNVSIVDTPKITWTGAVDATSDYYLLANPKENFFYQEIMPFVEGPWLQSGSPGQVSTFTKVGRTGFAVWSNPRSTDGSTWYKMMSNATITPNGA